MPEALAVAPEAFGAIEGIDLGIEGLGLADAAATGLEGAAFGADAAATGLDAAAFGADAAFGATDAASMAAADFANTSATASSLGSDVVPFSQDLPAVDPNTGELAQSAPGIQQELAQATGPTTGLGGGSELTQVPGTVVQPPATATQFENPGILVDTTPLDLGGPTGGGTGGIGSDFVTGQVGDLGVDTGGFSRDWGAEVASEITGPKPIEGPSITPIGPADASPMLSDTSVYQPGMTVDPQGGGYYNTPQGIDTYTGGPGTGTPGEDVTGGSTVGADGTTITTTTGKQGGGLFGNTGLGSIGQLAALGGIGIAALRGPGPLPSAGVTSEATANQLTSLGTELQQRAQANQISPAQRAQLQTIREQLVAQAYALFARMNPNGDPTQDSRFLQTIQNIDNQIAQQYQSFVNAEFQQGLQDLQLAQQSLGQVLSAQLQNDANFNAALFRAAQASTSLLGGGGGGTTTTTTVT